MMGKAPLYVLGNRLGKKLRKFRHKKHLEAIHPAVRMTAGALLACGSSPVELAARFRVIELKSLQDTDFTKWNDVYGYIDQSGRNRKGVAHQAVEKAEFTGRLAADIYDYTARRRQAAESAQVGKFKITENSPNTARITVGPDQRQRRKKYAWERVGFQRAAATAATAAAAVGAATLHAKLTSIGQGSAKVGLKNIFGKIAHSGRTAAAKIAGTEAKIKPFEPERGPADKLAQIISKRQQGAQKAAQSRRVKYGEKPVYVPAVHPEGHPQAGQPIMDPKTGKQKKKLSPRPKGNIIPGPGPAGQQTG